MRMIIFCTHLRRHCSMYRVRLFPMFLLLASICPAKPACSPVEEGEQTTLSCTVNTAKTCNTHIKMEWFVDSYTSGRILGCFNTDCGSFFRDLFTSTDSGSTLTISKVSRTVPAQFSMETRWTCRFCNGPDVTACNMLDIYAKPEKRSCTVTENTAVPGDIESVTVSCSTTKVYPKAKCSFERSASGGPFITINKTPTYNHTELTGSPVYYRSECSVDVPVAELGEGTHSFSAFIYPDVTDGIDLITTTIASATVTLTLPGASSYTCSPEMIQGYFNGKSARCTCSLTSDGYPKGQVQWYRGSQTVPGVSGGVVDLSFDSSNPEQVFICKGVSSIGASAGSILAAKFAFFEPDTVIIESASSTFNLCGDTNYTNNQLPTICRVPKDKIYPAPTFSFSEEGLTFDVPQKGRAESMFYLRQFYPSPAIGGVYQVSCRVANTVTGKTQERRTPVTVLKPPLLPPKITIRGKTYQGSNALNRITLAAGYTGDMTCRVEGGYPKAHTTQLTCGSLTASGEENVATLTFQDGQLNKDLDGTECRCTSQHVTGCYNNKEKSLTLDVTYAPVVTFTHNSASSEFNERDTPTFTCAAQGNPPPNLTITRKRTEQQLASIQRNLKTTELIHTLNPLDCLDTDVYVCTGQNNQDVTINEIIVGVKCPQQLASNTSQPETGEVVVGETVQLGLEIYGYPTPHLLTLMRARDGTNLTGSARHLIEFSLRQAPFGVVNVTISDVVEEDFTNYTIIVDNGEGEPLLYPFYLLKIEQEERKDNTVAIAVGVTIAVVVALGIVVILVVLVLRHSKARKSPLFQPAKENRYVDIFPDPADGYEVPVTQSEGEGMRPGGHTQVRINAYEEIDPTPANGYEMSDGPVQEEGHKGFRVNHYEEINPRIVNEYEVPNALVQEEDMRPKDETVQQSYTNCISSQQDNNETKDTKDNSYSNLGFDVGKEKCVYVNTEGHDT